MLQTFPAHIGRLDYTVVATDSETVTLQFQVPTDFAAVLPSLFRSLAETFSLVSHKARIAKAVERVRDPVEISKREGFCKKRDSFVLRHFDTFISSGESVRAAVRKTSDHLKSKGHLYGCYEVELIARNNGRFKKNKKAV